MNPLIEGFWSSNSFLQIKRRSGTKSTVPAATLKNVLFETPEKVHKENMTPLYVICIVPLLQHIQCLESVIGYPFPPPP